MKHQEYLVAALIAAVALLFAAGWWALHPDLFDWASSPTITERR